VLSASPKGAQRGGAEPEPCDAAQVGRWAERFSNRGRWGSRDERGTLNLITRDRVLAACALPRSGRAISCALRLEGGAPADALGPHPPVSPAPRPEDPEPGAEGAEAPPLPGATRWDGRARAAAPGADPVVARGVLLDLPRLLRLSWLEDGRPIRPEELDACAERSGVAIEAGDVLLVRTGRLTRALREHTSPGPAAGPAPGLSVHCARWLFEREIAAVASDTACVEVVPSEVPGCPLPLHRISLRGTQLLFGELFQLDALAEACARDGRYAFLFAAPLLPIAIEPLVVK
jgi:kynurenine formamidase